MPWRPVWLIRLSCAMLALGGCAAPAPYTDYDPAVDFSHFKSYAWIQADPSSSMSVAVASSRSSCAARSKAMCVP